MSDSNTDSNRNFVITVGRQFGSGGRELGKAIARELGIDYYDKELLVHAARNAGMKEEFFEKNDERSPSFLSGLLWFNMGLNPSTHYLGSNSISDDSLYSALSDIIHELARKGSCVIVGRTADYVLRDVDRVFNVFVHASEEACVNRILQREPSCDPKKARETLRRTNRLRASFYNFYTDKKWGDASSYDLTVDSSVVPIPTIARMIADIVRERFINNNA